jgi:DNA processing protein
MGREHWLRLAMTDGIGPILIRRLIERAGSAEAACTANATLLLGIEGIGNAKARTILESMHAAKVDDELHACDALGVRVICPDDDEYPTLLTQIPDPPAVLYVKGTFEPRDLNGLAIVGSRKCSYYGREQAERFAALLAGAGFTVISGGARGVDSSAHRGALSHSQGRTIAVLGSGIDVPYPPENAQLFEQIAARGAVISEYPLGTPPVAENFPRRNRIVSGMSRGVLVVEADERSGALITARQACDDHGRTVFAIPGRIDHSLSAGPHRLIRDGAVLTTSIDDIVQNLGPLPQVAMEPTSFGADSVGSDAAESATPQAATPAAPVMIDLTERQRLIVAHLSVDPVHVDALIERTELSAQDVLQELTLLSLKGVVKRIDGQSFVRSKSATIA